MPEQQPRQHKYYRLNIRVVEEVDEFKNKEDSHGGPGFYPEEILLTHSNQQITDEKLATVVRAVSRGEHSLIDICRERS